MSEIPAETKTFLADVAMMLARCRCAELPGRLQLDGAGHPLRSMWAHELQCPCALDAMMTGHDEPG